MPRMKKRSDGRYKGSFTYEGKRYYVYANAQADLPTAKAEKLKELKEGKKEHDNPTLNAYYEHLTEIRRDIVKESTIRAQRIQYRAIADVTVMKGRKFGEMRIRDITRDDILNVRAQMKADGKTPQYLNDCFAHLNHVFREAVAAEKIDRNPCSALEQLRRETPPITETKHRALTEEETETFFTTAAERHSFYYNAFSLMIKTGMRVGEIAALFPTDIDRKNGFINVGRTVIRNEAGGYEIGNSTKTYSGERKIPLTDELIKIIDRQREQNGILFGLDREGLLFRSPEGAILREYTCNREIKRICQAADIELFTCHAFRATFATRFIEQRPQDYKILSEILGHKDISITLNLYTHVMQSKKIEAMNSISVKTG